MYIQVNRFSSIRSLKGVNELTSKTVHINFPLYIKLRVAITLIPPYGYGETEQFTSGAPKKIADMRPDGFVNSIIGTLTSRPTRAL